MDELILYILTWCAKRIFASAISNLRFEGIGRKLLKEDDFVVDRNNG